MNSSVADAAKVTRMTIAAVVAIGMLAIVPTVATAQTPATAEQSPNRRQGCLHLHVSGGDELPDDVHASHQERPGVRQVAASRSFVAERQGYCHTQQRHALLLRLGGPAGRTVGAHDAEDRAGAVLHQPVGRLLGLCPR